MKTVRTLATFALLGMFAAPALAQLTTFPVGSVIDTSVLLKVAWM